MYHPRVRGRVWDSIVTPALGGERGVGYQGSRRRARAWAPQLASPARTRPPGCSPAGRTVTLGRSLRTCLPTGSARIRSRICGRAHQPVVSPTAATRSARAGLRARSQCVRHEPAEAPRQCICRSRETPPSVARLPTSPHEGAGSGQDRHSALLESVERHMGGVEGSRPARGANGAAKRCGGPSTASPRGHPAAGGAATHLLPDMLQLANASSPLLLLRQAACGGLSCTAAPSCISPASCTRRIELHRSAEAACMYFTPQSYCRQRRGSRAGRAVRGMRAFKRSKRQASVAAICLRPM